MDGNNIHSIHDLWTFQKEIWKQENEKYFGITPLDNWSDERKVQEHLEDTVKRLWNGGTNLFKELLVDGGKCNDIDKMVPGSWELLYDQSGLICLYAKFRYVEHQGADGEAKEVERRSPIAYLPVPDELCWHLGETRYALRISAMLNYGLINRRGDKVYYQKTWTYDLKTKQWNIKLEGFDPFDDITAMNREWLAGWLKLEDPATMTREQFEQALHLLPEWDPCAVYNFRFKHVDGMFDLVRTSKRFANPMMKVAIPINVVKMFTAQRRKADATDRNGSNSLVLATNDLYALENVRTIIYRNEFNMNFSFSSTMNWFDSFKTSTNKSAGKSRLLLDGVIVKDGKLWNWHHDPEHGWKLDDMWSWMSHPDWKVTRSISVLSGSSFGSNNAPKRIMMTAKMRAQAIPVAGEEDPLTHEIRARIVFGDFKGYNYGDGIICSRSFARRMRSHKRLRIQINTVEQWKWLTERYRVGDRMRIDDLLEMVDGNSHNNFRNIMITGIDDEYLNVEADLPFSVGDKLTNLHGSKGVCVLIMEDDEMPFLMEDIVSENGTVFPAGPMEVIVSGLSVFRRKSLGQILEGWAVATGHDDVDNIQDAVDRYYDDMIHFSDHSLVRFGGKVTRKPLGVNAMLRLDHNACGKQSLSYVKSNYARMLKAGEMELLNLSARGLTAMLNEIDIRSVSKHANSLEQIRRMQSTGKIVQEPANSLRFFSMLRAAGFEIKVETDPVEPMDEGMSEHHRLLTDDVVPLFGDI